MFNAENVRPRDTGHELEHESSYNYSRTPESRYSHPPTGTHFDIKGGAKEEAANLRPALDPSGRATCSDDSHGQFSCEMRAIKLSLYQCAKARLSGTDYPSLTKKIEGGARECIAEESIESRSPVEVNSTGPLTKSLTASSDPPSATLSAVA